MKKYFICILIVMVICGGCIQKGPISGDYRNIAHNTQFIVFTDEGMFSHYNYNNTRDLFKTGTFTSNNTVLIMYYKDGQISKFSIEHGGNELIPINENKSESSDNDLENRFAKRLEQ